MTEIEWLHIFADNLATIMYEMKVTQKELAELSGLSEPTISKYLRKQQMPGIKAIINIAYALNLEFDNLIDFGDMIRDS